MKITRETDHAINCVLYLSIQQFECVSVSELSQKLNIPRQFLAKIVQKLSKADILESLQGKSGGFKLSRPPAQVSLYDVFLAIQSVPAINSCIIETGSCNREGYCAARIVWTDIQSDIVEKLQKTDFLALSRNEFENLRKLQELKK